MLDQNIYSLNKIAFHNSANCNYVSFFFGQDVHMSARNNFGKTAKLNGIQIGFIPKLNFKNAKRKFYFDKEYKDSESYDFYFPDSNSYIIYEFENPHGVFCQIIYKGQGDLEIERAFVKASYDDILHWFWVFKDNDSIGKPTRISRKDLVEKIKSTENYKIVKKDSDASELMYNGSLTDEKKGLFSVVSVSENRKENIFDIIKISANASKITPEILKKIIINLLKTNYKDNERDQLKYDPVDLINKFQEIKFEKESLTKKKNFLSDYNSLKQSFQSFNDDSNSLNISYNLIYKSLESLIKNISKIINEKSLEEIRIKLNKDKLDKESSENKGLIKEEQGSLKVYNLISLKNNNKKTQYEDLVFSEDSDFFIFKGDHEKILENIEMSISENKEILDSLSNIRKTLDDIDNLKEELSKLNEKKENLVLQKKNNGNLLIANESLKDNSGLLSSINSAFSSVEDIANLHEIEAIKNFANIFSVSNSIVTFKDIKFGYIKETLKSSHEIAIEISNIDIEIESLKKELSKKKKLIDIEDTEIETRTRKELALLKKEKQIVNDYESVKETIIENDKNIKETNDKISKLKDIIKEIDDKINVLKKDLIDLSTEIKSKKSVIEEYKELLDLLKSKNDLYKYIYIPVDISDESLNKNVSKKDIDNIEKIFSDIRSYKVTIFEILTSFVKNEIIYDNDTYYLKSSNSDLKVIESDWIPKIDNIFLNIDDDEDRILESYERQKLIILDLSKDLSHHINNNKAYINKLGAVLK